MASILATRTHTGEIVAKMLCFRRMAIWSSGSLLKTLANTSIEFWIQSCGLYHIKTPESDISMKRDGPNDEWVTAKGLCRLSDDEVRMARELGIGPRALIKNIPNPQQRWKAPVGVWIRNLYTKKRTKKPVPAPLNASSLVVDPHKRPRESEFKNWPSDFDPPTEQGITEENEFMLRRQREFRLAAEYVAAAFAQFEPVQKIVLFGSAALRLEKEIPRFRKFRRAGQPIFHECKDVDLAVWLTDLTILKSLQRARSQALNDLFAEHEIGVAHHQVDVFLMTPESDAYLGRLCNFGECPKGKRECLVQNCGAVKFLRQIEGFAFHPDALSSAKAITLFARGASTLGRSLDELWEIPF